MRFDFLTDRIRATLESFEELSAALIQLDEGLPSSISVVGNAQSLLSRSYGVDIDAHATIRFNHAQIVDPAAQGTRWDFVATSSRTSLQYYRDHEPRFSHLLYTAHINKHMRNLREVGSDRPVLKYPLRLSRELLLLLNARPTTGTQVLFLLDRLERKNVAVFGFDWKATPTFYDVGRARDPHKHQKEMDLVEGLIQKNGWQLYM